jgi:hypothetical protein
MLHLCKLPAAQEVSSDDVLQLLRLAVERSTTDCVLYLCKLPAAQQISSDMYCTCCIQQLQAEAAT